MSSPPTIKMNLPARKAMSINVEGTLYWFKQPKKRWLMTAAAGLSADADPEVQAAAYRQVEELLLRCMTEEGAEHLRARLEDPDDVVDVEQVMEVFQELMGAASGLPPTLPDDSSPSPTTGDLTTSDGPSPTESGNPI